MSVVSKRHKELVNKTNKMIINEVVGRRYGNKIRTWRTRGAYTLRRLLIHLNAMRYKTFANNGLFGEHMIFIDCEEWDQVMTPRFEEFHQHFGFDFQFEPGSMYFDSRKLSYLHLSTYNFGTENDYTNEMRNVPNQHRQYFDFLAVIYDRDNFIVFLNNRFIVYTPTGHTVVSYHDIFGNDRRASTFYDLAKIIVDLYNLKIIGRAGTLQVTRANITRALNNYYTNSN
jgi:hypothetical protein